MIEAINVARLPRVSEGLTRIRMSEMRFSLNATMEKEVAWFLGTHLRDKGRPISLGQLLAEPVHSFEVKFLQNIENFRYRRFTYSPYAPESFPAFLRELRMALVREVECLRLQFHAQYGAMPWVDEGMAERLVK